MISADPAAVAPLVWPTAAPLKRREDPLFPPLSSIRDGIAYGTSVLDRRKLLLAFLTQAIGIDEDVATGRPARWYAIGDESFERWVAYADRIGLEHVERPCL